MQVLVADDDATTRFALRKKLKEWGYDVVEAGDGAEAWQILSRDEPPSIAILDWMMPALDGVEICKRLADRPSGPFIYTILLTSKSGKEDLVFALENGAHNFQSKPISTEEIRSHVNVGRRLVEQLRKSSEPQVAETTGNARFIESVLRQRLEDLVREGWGLGLIALELDRLRWIEETYGAEEAEEAQSLMARALMGELRASDVLGCWAEKALLVVLPRVDHTELSSFADRFRLLIEQSGLGQGEEMVRSTISVGAALAMAEDSPSSLIARAMSCLGESKSQGGGCVTIDPPLTVSLSAALP